MRNRKSRMFRRRSNGRDFRRQKNGSENMRLVAGSFTNYRVKSNFQSHQSAEKLLERYKILAKEALSSGDKILSENYLQHADHYLRRFNELNERKEGFNEKSKASNSNLTQNEIKQDDKDLQQTNN